MENQGKSVAGMSASYAGSSSSSRARFGLVSELESSVLDLLSGGFVNMQKGGEKEGDESVKSEEFSVSLPSPGKEIEQSKREQTISDEFVNEEKNSEKFYTRRNKQETVKIEEQPFLKLDEDGRLVKEDNETFSRKDFQREEMEAEVPKNDEDVLIMSGDEVREPERARWNLRPRKPMQRPKVLNPREALRSSSQVGESVERRNHEFPTASVNGNADAKKEKKMDNRNEKERDNKEKAKDKGKKKGDNMPIMPKFSLSLTKEEIEEDFIKMTGQKPPKKFKKRTKTAQKKLDQLFPGMNLGVITPNDYRVPENTRKG